MDFHDESTTLFATGERSDGSDTHILMTIDPQTGAGTEVGPTGLEFFSDSITFGTGFDTATDISFRNVDDTLFAYTFDNDGLATTDVASGAMTEIGKDISVITVGNTGYGIAFADNDTLFMSDRKRVPPLDVRLHILDQTGAGVVSSISLSLPTTPVLVFPRINAMDFDPDTGTLFGSLNDGVAGSGPVYLVTIDIVTGAVTFIGQTVNGLDAIAFVDADTGCKIPVDIDLKPGSNPNCVNLRARGQVTVAIFGNDVEVTDIDQSTIEFSGAAPVRCNIEDALMEGPTLGFTTDGVDDLVCQFKTQEVEWPTAGWDCETLQLTGALNDGTLIQGSDTACLAGEPTCKASTPIPVD
jgi:hypothetical protein